MITDDLSLEERLHRLEKADVVWVVSDHHGPAVERRLYLVWGGSRRQYLADAEGHAVAGGAVFNTEEEAVVVRDLRNAFAERQRAQDACLDAIHRAKTWAELQVEIDRLRAAEEAETEARVRCVRVHKSLDDLEHRLKLKLGPIQDRHSRARHGAPVWAPETTMATHEVHPAPEVALEALLVAERWSPEAREGIRSCISLLKTGDHRSHIKEARKIVLGTRES